MSKVNELKELALALDGMSIEKTGFKILKAEQTYGVWTVFVESYEKEEGEFLMHEDGKCITTLVARLTNNYMYKDKWDILSVAKVGMKYGFKLDIALKGEGEESEKEDGSCVEEQVEA